MKATTAIPNGQAVTPAVPLNTKVLVGILMPAAWDAADIQLEGSMDGQTFVPIYDAAGNRLAVVVGANRYVVLSPDATEGVNTIRLRSVSPNGTTDVNQTALRTLQLELSRD